MYSSVQVTRTSISIPFEALGRKLTLVDTAGMRAKSSISNELEKLSVMSSIRYLSSDAPLSCLIRTQRRAPRECCCCNAQSQYGAGGIGHDRACDTSGPVHCCTRRARGPRGGCCMQQVGYRVYSDLCSVVHALLGARCRRDAEVHSRAAQSIVRSAQRCSYRSYFRAGGCVLMRLLSMILRRSRDECEKTTESGH